MHFYTYLWLREDGTPYYVGKGRGRRGFVTKNHRMPRPKDRTRIITQDHLSESDAFLAEKILIAAYGRKDLGTGCLANMTDGGEGASGHVMSDEHKRRIGLANKGQKRGRGRPKLRKYPQHRLQVKLPTVVVEWLKNQKTPMRTLILNALCQVEGCPGPE